MAGRLNYVIDSGSLFRLKLVIAIFVNFLCYVSNHKLKVNEILSFKLRPIVELDVYPNEEIEINPNHNFTIAWSATPTSIATNSWVGVYLYAQKNTHSAFSSYTINKTNEGSCLLSIPEESGVYQVRLIQDNNLHTIAASGPLYVNPNKNEISLKLTKSEFNLGEKTNIEFALSELWIQKIKLDKSQVSLCLNIVGSYDDCIWQKYLDHHVGFERVTLPKFSAYFVMRLLVKTKSWYQSEYHNKPIYTSKMFKVSAKDIFLINEKDTSIVGSTVITNWIADSADISDWIGLYTLDNSEVYDKASTPLNSIKVRGNKKGKFEAFLPPNSDLGPMVFIYFSNYMPVAISNIITLTQPLSRCNKNNSTLTNIKHLVIICTENHSFDSYFGNYCENQVSSNPKCNEGAKCCEASPPLVNGQRPFILNDTQNMQFDPNHNQDCEICQINSGKMDGYLQNCPCSDPRNFAVADKQTVEVVHNLARNYSLADRYFQPSAGSSSQNNMYFARASYVFKDNSRIASGVMGSNCWYLIHHIPDEFNIFYDPTITSLLAKCGFKLKTYAEGYRNASSAFDKNKCYPEGFDSADIPFQYYAGIFDKEEYINDYDDFKEHIRNKTLPEVAFIKPLGIKTGHPGASTITDEMKFIQETVDAVLSSSYGNDTLILWVPDESGGYYDHVSPPKTNEVDGVPYGPRIPMIAIGNFAKQNYISHVVMEHSSIVKFIEWNWLDGITGQLNTRDRNVNSIGDLIDEAKAGRTIPN